MATRKSDFIRWFDEISIADVPLVGGKNASLGELYRELGKAGIRVPNGFAVTAEGYRFFVAESDLGEALHELVEGLDTRDVEDLRHRGAAVRNLILAHEFAEIFDGFSIGSNDLTQLVLGVDRDSSLVAHVFDERNPAVKTMIAWVIREARKCGRKIGICGQAPSDYPDFAEFLVEQGIDSISLNPDAVLKTSIAILETEKASAEASAPPLASMPLGGPTPAPGK